MSSQPFFHRPLVPLALAAEGGCLAGALGWGEGPYWLAAALLGLGIAWAARQGRQAPLTWLGLMTASVCVYAALSWQAGVVPGCSLARELPRQDLRLEGVLCSWPKPNAFETGWQADMACTQAVDAQGRREVSGIVKIQAPGLCPAWAGGDRVAVRGAVSAFAEPGNPGEFDYAAFERRQGVVGVCRAAHRSEVVRLSRAEPWSLGAVSVACHRHWVNAIWRNVSPTSRSLVASLVLGDRNRLPRALQEAMAATGMAHILAVSGMNIGLVLASLLALARVCHLPRALGWLLGLAGVALFSAMAGASPSVLRAALMAGISIFSLWWERPGDGLSVLSLTALLLLAWDPRSGADPGFQLSYAATAGLIAAAPWFPDYKNGWLKWGAKILSALGLTAVAMASTFPLQWLYFYSVTPAGLFSNLAALPLVTAATDGGLLLGLVGPLWPAGAKLIGWATGWAGQGIVAIAQMAQTFPGGRFFIGSVDPFWAAAAYAGAALGFWKKTRVAGLVALAVLAAMVPAFRTPPPAPGETRFTFLDLGMGESTLVETASGKRFLMDAGTESEFLWRVKPFLASQGINRLDGLVLSHPDADHAGGAVQCLKCFQVRQVLMAGSDDAKTRAFRAYLSKKFISCQPLIRGDHVVFDPGSVLEVLWPPRVFEERAGRPGKLRRPGAARPGTNAHSLVARWTFPGGDALFTGDADVKSEAHWLGLRPVRLLKVAHHGSRHASGEGFLGQVIPELSVVQSGFFGQHHFPHPETRARLQLYSGTVLDTALFGAVQVTFSPEGDMRWQSWK